MMISLDRFKATFLGKCNSVCLLGGHLPEVSVVEDQTPDHNVFFIQPTVSSFTHSFILHPPTPPKGLLGTRMDKAHLLISVKSHIFRGMHICKHKLYIRTVMTELSMLCVFGGVSSAEDGVVIPTGGSEMAL